MKTTLGLTALALAALCVLPAFGTEPPSAPPLFAPEPPEPGAAYTDIQTVGAGMWA